METSKNLYKTSKRSGKCLLFAVLTLLMLFTAGLTAYAGEWQHDGIGWKYLQDNGQYAADNGYIINGVSYGFDADGHMLANTWSQTKVGGHWVYYGADGVKLTNAWIDGKYYVGSNGWMLTNKMTPDGYYVGADGAWDGKPSSLPTAPKQASSQETLQKKSTTQSDKADSTKRTSDSSASDHSITDSSRNTITATIGGETDTYYLARTSAVSGTYHFIAYSLKSDGSPGKRLHIQVLSIEQPGNVRPSDLTLVYRPEKGGKLYDNTPSTTFTLTSGGKHIAGSFSGTLKAHDSSTITVESASFDLYFGETVEAAAKAAQEAGEFDEKISDIDNSVLPDTSSGRQSYTCTFCHGSGSCNSCAGRGVKQNRFDHAYYDCALCGGTGRCAYCNGLGRIR